MSAAVAADDGVEQPASFEQLVADVLVLVFVLPTFRARTLPDQGHA